MQSRVSADGCELTLEASREEWRRLAIGLTAGELVFPLDDGGDPAPYHEFAKRLIIEPTDEPLSCFLVAPGTDLCFIATPARL